MSFDNRSSTRDANGGNSDMESQPPSLCKAGCGFYGNPAFEGLCSVCYKDKVKYQMQALPTATRPISPHLAPSLSEPVSGDTATPDAASSTHSSQTPSDSTEACNSVPSVETGAPTISGAVPADKSASSTSTADCGSAQVSEGAVKEAESSATSAKDVKEPESAVKEKPKKNRCLTCKKKVGLTGFQCRCNGLFCTTHRYSDMHDCPFNYKELGQEQIRKNNPVVVGQKITKI